MVVVVVVVLCVPGVVGKERKRLYEEGLTAGAVTATTAVAAVAQRRSVGSGKEELCRQHGYRGEGVPSLGRTAV